MKAKLGGVVVLLFSAACFLGVAGYLGVWCCYVGAVVDFIDVCKAPTTDGWAVAWCLLRFFVGGTLMLAVGFWGGVLSFFGGVALLAGGKPKPKPPTLFDRIKARTEPRDPAID